MKNYKTIIGAAVVGLTLAAASSEAQLNIPTGSISGSLLNQELVGVSPGGNVGANNGAVSSWVVNDPAADSQGLIFIYQVLNNGGDGISQVELTGFSAGQIVSTANDTSVTIGALLTPIGSTPAVGAGGTTTAFNTTSLVGNGLTFEAGANQNLGIGGISDYLIVETDVNYFGPSFGQIQDNFSAQGNILAPVPEANTVVAGALMLLPLGIGAVRALRKERTA
jgi:hypothetical protein